MRSRTWATASDGQRLHGSCGRRASRRCRSVRHRGKLLRAHWGEIAGVDFFTTEVWTWRGLITFYTVFVILLASRRVQILGSTPHSDEAFMSQIARTLTSVDGKLYGVLICDRDAKWSERVRARLEEGGLRVIQTPYRAPNAKDR